MQQNPFKFLSSYQKEDTDIYFGRDKEVNELYKRVRKSQIILLYGLSGTGKTSLVQCGLANRFDDSDWMALSIRRNKNILNSIRDVISDSADTLMRPNTPLVKQLHALYLDYFRPIYLIFDQFEELFISGSQEEINEFIEFLADIANSSETKVRVILILREEYFTNLDQFEEKVPIIFNSRMRLERMTTDTISAVIKDIAKMARIEIREEARVIPKIIENVSTKNMHVELPYLQVYLDKLNKLMEGHKYHYTFNLDLVNELGKLDDILGVFLEEQVEKIGEEIGDKELVWKVLKLLITDEGTKNPMDLDELRAKL